MSIVVLGDHTPRIFRPDWFVRHKIIGEADGADAVVEVIHDDIVSFKTGSIAVNVDRQRLRLQVGQEPMATLLDMLMNIAPLIAETPAIAFGINTEWHTALGGEQRWHAFGDLVAPKEPWGNFLKDGEKRLGGLHTVAHERQRPENPEGLEGYTRIHMQPSSRVKHGLFMLLNDHFSFKDEKKATIGTVGDYTAACWQLHLDNSSLLSGLIDHMADSIK